MNTQRRIFWILFWGGILFRCAYILSGVTDLAPDETYYWQWSRRPDWSYYSKGPMIAYLIWLGTHCFGHTPFGVRFPTIVLSGLTLWVAFRLYENLFPKNEDGIAWLAVFYHTIPLFLVGSIVATIDPPFCAAWIAALYALHRAVRQDWRWGWPLLALSLGLGILSKYTMLLFIPTILLYIAGSPENRRWLKRPEGHLALIGGLLFLLPPLLWNAGHQWVSFQHTASIGKFDQPTHWIDNLINFPLLLMTQSAVISPILFLLILYALWQQAKATRGSRRNDSAFLILSAVLPLAFFYICISFKRSIIPNWLAAIYPAAVLAAAEVWSRRLRENKGKRLVLSGVCLGAAICLFLLFSDVIHWAGLPSSERWDPAARLKGWKELAELAETASGGLPNQTPYFYFGTRYQIASELAFYLKNQPMTYCASYLPLTNQYDIWGGSKQRLDWNAVFADQARTTTDLWVPAHVEKAFERIEPLDPVPIRRYGKILGWNRIWRCYGFRGWPLNTELTSPSKDANNPGA